MALTGRVLMSPSVGNNEVVLNIEGKGILKVINLNTEGKIKRFNLEIDGVSQNIYLGSSYSTLLAPTSITTDNPLSSWGGEDGTLISLAMNLPFTTSLKLTTYTSDSFGKILIAYMLDV